MKKVSIFIATLALIIMTGCTKTDKLICTQEEKLEGSTIATMSSKSIISFENGYAVKYETTQETVFEDEETAKEYMTNFEDSDGYVVKQDGNKVIINYTQSVNKDASKNEEDKKEYIKEYLEGRNFKCR